MNKFIQYIKNTCIASLAILSSGKIISDVAHCEKFAIKAKQQKNIAVLDDFTNKEIFINDDNIPDLTHGETIVKIIKNGLKNVCIDAFDTPILNKQNSKYKKILTETLLNNDKHYDGANVSIGVDVTFEELSTFCGIKLTPENIKNKAKEVKQILKNKSQQPLHKNSNITLGGVSDIIEVLDSLSKKGTKIYVSSSNEGEQSLNLLSLVDNSITVGAKNSEGIKNYSNKNSLVKGYYNDEIRIVKTRNGYSLLGDKQITDINETEITGKCKNPYKKTQKGSSFATPRYMVAHLQKIWDK